MALAGVLQANATVKSDDFSRGMRSMRAELAQLRQSADTTATGFAGLGKSVVGLAAGAFSLGAITAGIKDIVLTGTGLSNLRGTFAAITGTLEGGRQEFGFVRDTANRLGLDLDTLGASYKSLSAATRGTAIEGQGARDLLVALSGASRTYGLSTEATGRALTAFQQIVGKGVVSQEELRGQLAEALPGATQIAARAYGVSTQELNKLVEKGLDAVEFTRKFTAQLQRETPAATDIAGDGIRRLSNQILLLKGRFADSGLVAFLDRLANKGAALLDIGAQASDSLQSAVLGRVGEAAKLATPEELRELLATAGTVGVGPARLSGLSPSLRADVQARQDSETRAALGS